MEASILSSSAAAPLLHHEPLKLLPSLLLLCSAPWPPEIGFFKGQLVNDGGGLGESSLQNTTTQNIRNIQKHNKKKYCKAQKDPTTVAIDYWLVIKDLYSWDRLYISLRSFNAHEWSKIDKLRVQDHGCEVNDATPRIGRDVQISCFCVLCFVIHFCLG